MYDSTIHPKTIGRQFRKADFESKVWTATKDDRPAIIRSATRLANDGFETLSFRTNHIGGKPIFRHASLAEALLIRHVSENVRRVTGVKQSDRQEIVRSLRELLKEGVAFNVIKLDIKSFYESIDTGQIVSDLEEDSAFSRQSIKVLRSFCDCLATQNIDGLPRGIGLSATLSEYLLRAFDAKMRAMAGVKFYSRYVDDMIVISQAREMPNATIEKASGFLPSGLEFNRSKTRPYRFKESDPGSAGTPEGCLSFLGYDLTVGKVESDERSAFRKVTLDIAAKKVARLKRRISKSILAFNNGGSFEDLRDRFRILTSNFAYQDELTDRVRYSGIRYNYSLIDPNASPALDALDRFSRNVVTSTHPNNRLLPNLSKSERHALLSFGFKAGFVENRFFSFKQDRLHTLIGCWLHA